MAVEFKGCHINYKTNRLVNAPVAFPASAITLTTAQITLPLPNSPTLYLQYYCYYKNLVAHREFLIHTLSLASVPTNPL